MEIVTTCINCLPAPSNFAINAVLAISMLAVAIYRTA